MGAQTWDKAMYLTFSGPVQVPKVILPGGTYTFRLAGSVSNRSVMQVLSRDGTRFFGNFMTMPRHRNETTDDPAVLFLETPAGVPPAIRAVFYPAEYTGWEFIYPKGHDNAVSRAIPVSPLVIGAGLGQTTLN
jgi:hypothetical protein